MGRWAQAICDRCWLARYGERVPTRLRDPDEERCGWCGQPTRSGIYVRADPTTVPFPRVPADEEDADAADKAR